MGSLHILVYVISKVIRNKKSPTHPCQPEELRELCKAF